MRRNPLLVVLALLASCGGDGTGPDLSLATLSGRWALSGAELQEVGNPANSFSFYDAGIRGAIVIEGGGRFIFEVRAPGETPDSTIGSVAIGHDTLFYDAEGGYHSEFRLSLAGATMHWVELEPQEAADLDGDGTVEDVITVLDWRKQ